MVNQVVLVGNLGKDPDIRKLANGKAVCSLRLATNRKWKDQEGKLQEDTQWHTVTAWGGLAETCEKYLEKGRQIFVSGWIKNSTYEKDGQTKFSSEVVAEEIKFLGKREKEEPKANGDAEYKTPF